MMKRVFIGICAALAIVCWASCNRPDLPKHDVTITLNTGDIVTRVGDGVVADGGGIAIDNGKPDLAIIITQGSGVSEEYVSGYFGENTSSASATTPTSTQIQVTFSLTTGTYNVYAVANTFYDSDSDGVNDGLWGAPPDWSAVAATALMSRQFTALTGSDRPTISGGRMPLSASGTLTVRSSGAGSVSLELLRCVAKVSVRFKNVTGGALVLGNSGDANDNVSFYISDMNPENGYIISASGTDSRTPATLRPLVISANSMSLADDATVEIPGGPFFVFPSAASGGTYYCSTKFNWTLTKANESPVNGTYANGVYYNPEDANPTNPSTPGDPTTGLRVHDSQSVDIPALSRNQHLTIEIRIGKGNMVSFNFFVGDWDSKTETVLFT